MVTCHRHHSNGLHGAIRESNIDLVNYFLHELKSNLVDVLTHETKFGDSLLTYTVSSRNKEDLLQSGIIQALPRAVKSVVREHSQTFAVSDFVDMETSKGKIAIIEAVKNNDADCVSLLLSHDANAKRPSRIHKKSALDWAIALGHENISNMINDHLQLVDHVRNLFQAISKCDMAIVQSLTEGGVPFQRNQDVTFRKELESRSTRLDLAKQSMTKIYLSLNEALTSKTQVQSEIQKGEERIEGIVKKREDIASNLRSSIAVHIAKVRLATTPDNVNHVCSMTNPPLQYELIAKALCTLLHVKVKNSNIEQSQMPHWEATKRLFQMNGRFFHRIRHYHGHYHVVELATQIEVEGLPGTCLDHLSSILNRTNNQDQGDQAMGSALLMSVAQWLWTIFKALPRHKLEHELVMKESTERDILERNRIHSNVLVSRSSILKRELDDVTRKIKSDTMKNVIMRQKLKMSGVMKHVIGRHSVLSWASGVGNAELVKLLRKRGAHTAIGDDCFAWCATLIQVAFRHSLWVKRIKSSRDINGLRLNHIFAVSLRIKSLSNLIRDKLGGIHLPLAQALYNGHSKVAMLLDDVDIPIFQALNMFPLFYQPNGTVPRSFSCDSIGVTNRSELVSFILGAGQKYHCTQDPGNCVFVNALKCTMDLTVNFLKQRRSALKAKIATRRETLSRKYKNAQASVLRQAIYQGDFKQMVKASEEGGISLDYEDSGMTPLIRAAMEDTNSPIHEWCYNSVGEQVTAVAYLLDRISPHRPSVNHESRLGHTALSMACRMQNYDLKVIKDLLDRGADAKKKSLVSGQSPFMYACSGGKLQIVEQLTVGIRKSR